MKVLVAGIGNIFLGDDGFGVAVVRRMERHPVPDGVAIADYGIRSVHLAYELLNGYDALVLVDAMPLGEPPGTVAVFEPDPVGIAPGPVDGHTMSPAAVLGLLAGMGGSVGRVLVVGCQPLTLEEEIGLSDPVTAAVEPAIAAIERLLDGICSVQNPHECHEEKIPIMIHRVFFGVLLAVVAGLVVESLPDIARYLKLREM